MTGNWVRGAPELVHWSLKVPSTLVFTYTPVEDPAVYEKVFKPFTDHLAKCVDKRVVFYQVQSNAAEIEAMRSGRLHVATSASGFRLRTSAGPVPRRRASATRSSRESGCSVR